MRIHRRVLRISLRVLLGLLVLLVALWCLRGPLLSATVADRVEQILLEEVGLKLEIGRLGGNWITGVELEDVRLVASPGIPEIRQAEIRRLVASVSLPALLKGRDGWIRHVEIDGLRGRVDLDTPTPDDEVEEKDEDGPSPDVRRTLARWLPAQAVLRDVDAELLVGGRTIRVEGMTVRGSGDALRGAEASIAMTTVAIDGPAGSAEGRTLRFDARLEGDDLSATGGLAVAHGTVGFDLRADGLLIGAPRLGGTVELDRLRPGPPARALLARLGASFRSIEGEIELDDVDLGGGPLPPGNVQARLAADEVVAQGWPVGAVTVRVAGPARRFRFVVSARDGAVDLDVEGVAGLQGRLQATVHGRASDLGLVDVDVGGRALRGEAKLRGRVRLIGGDAEARVSLVGRDLALDEVPVGAVDLRARISPRRLVVDELLLRRGADHARLRGRLELGGERRIALDGDLHVEDVEGLGDLAGVDLRGRASGRARIRGPLLDPTGTVRLVSEGLGVEDLRTEEVVVDATVAPGRLTLRQLLVRLPDASIEIAAEAERESWRELHAGITTLTIGYRDTSLALTDPAAFHLEADGRLRIEGLRLEGPLADVALEGARAPDGSLDANLELHRVDAGRVATLASLAELDFLRAGTLSGRIGAKDGPDGPAVEADLTLDAPVVTLPDGTTIEPAKVAVAVGAGSDGIRLERLDLDLPAGTLHAEGAVSFPPGSALDSLPAIEDLSGNLVLRTGDAGLDLARIARRAIGWTASGRVTIDARVEGSLVDPVVGGEIRVEDGRGRIPGLPEVEALEVHVTADRSAIRLRELRARSAATTVTAKGSLALVDHHPDTIDLTATVTTDDLLRPLAAFGVHLPPRVRTGRATVLLSAKGSVADPAVVLNVTGEDLRWADEQPGRLTLRVRTDGDRIRVEDLLLDSRRGKITGQGSLPGRISLDPPGLRLARLTGLEGHLTCGDPEASGGGFLLDGLERILPRSTGVRRMNGRIAFRVDHAAGEPFQRSIASVHLKDVGVRFHGRRRGVGGVTGKVDVREGEIDVDVSGRFGHAPFSVKGDLRPDEKDDWRWDLEVKGDRLLLLNDPDVRMRADLALRWTGTASGSGVSGTARVRDLLYTRNVHYLRFSSQPELAPLPLSRSPFLASIRLDDVRIQAGQVLRLENNVIRTAAQGDLRIGGTVAWPEIDGRVWTESGRLTLPMVSLRLDSAEVEFRPRGGLRPTIAASCSTTRRRIRIEVSASGPPDDLVIELASDPAFPREAVLTLLTTGVLPSELSAGTAGEAAAWAGAQYLFDEIRGSSSASADEKEGTLARIGRQIAERTEVSVDSVPGGREPIVSATFRVLDWLRLQGEKDELGEYSIDVVFRVVGR